MTNGYDFSKAGKKSSGTTGKSRSKNPVDHLGVYRDYDDVPRDDRLEKHAGVYAGRDVWGEYLESRTDLSDSTKNRTYKWAFNAWRSFIEDEEGTHHALATPDQVERFIADATEEYTGQTVYAQRFAPIYGFYEWLAMNIDYPHQYNVVLMAAAKGGATYRAWLWRWPEERN